MFANICLTINILTITNHLLELENNFEQTIEARMD